MSIFRSVFRVVFVTVLAGDGAFAADAPVVPVTVCELVSDMRSLQGKDLAVLGRYSFRESSGRTLNEQECSAPAPSPPLIKLVEAPAGPKPSDGFEINGAELQRKFSDLRKRTSLGKFRFGTADYDRWAVVYGRIEPAAANDVGSSANLVFRGDGVIILLTADR